MNGKYNKYLPDFVSKKVDMLEASKMLKEAIDKICKVQGHDPKWETLIRDAKLQGYGENNQIVVSFEACDVHDWGVAYSMGSNPKSYNPMKNIQDWYLECYYGFDVMFTPKEDNGKKYHSIKTEKVSDFYNHRVEELVA